MRALDRACTTGAHGLPLMGAGDWNDGMNRVGVDGKGESVWLAWFLDRDAAAVRRACDGARRRGGGGAAAAQRADDYAAAVEAHAWDGAWYRRAYFDDGTPLGSAQSDECQIDAIAQSWAVISGAGDPERARIGHGVGETSIWCARMRGSSCCSRRRSITPRTIPATSRAICPACARTARSTRTPRSGRCSPPRALGDGDRADAADEMLNPLTHASTADAMSRATRSSRTSSRADVYTAPRPRGPRRLDVVHRLGELDVSRGARGVLGFTKRGNELRIDPCVPSAWRDFTLTYRHGASTYAIDVRNPDGVATGVVRVDVDGVAVAERVVHLVDDGTHHEVIVTMGAVAPR